MVFCQFCPCYSDTTLQTLNINIIDFFLLFLIFWLKSMKFYFIWTKPFSFELKNTKNIEIINPKKAIKMIFIQKSYSVLLGPFCLLWSTLVLFVLCWSYWVQSIQIGHILSSSVLFGSHWSYSVHFGSIRFTLVLFGPLCPLQSTLVLFGPHWSYLVHMSTLVLIYPLVLIRSCSIHLVLIMSYYVLLHSICVHFGPFLCTYI